MDDEKHINLTHSDEFVLLHPSGLLTDTNDVWKRMYQFYNAPNPVNENQGFFLNLSREDLENIEPANEELKVPNYLFRWYLHQNRAQSSQDMRANVLQKNIWGYKC